MEDHPQISCRTDAALEVILPPFWMSAQIGHGDQNLPLVPASKASAFRRPSISSHNHLWMLSEIV